MLQHLQLSAQADKNKVIDSSDVVIHVLDARDPDGTRCRSVEKYIKEEAPHKHLLFVLNKCDLIPTSVAVSLSFSVSFLLQSQMFKSRRLTALSQQQNVRRLLQLCKINLCSRRSFSQEKESDCRRLDGSSTKGSRCSV